MPAGSTTFLAARDNAAYEEHKAVAALEHAERTWRWRLDRLPIGYGHTYGSVRLTRVSNNRYRVFVGGREIALPKRHSSMSVLDVQIAVARVLASGTFEYKGDVV